jgi:RNase P subunit RPR2
VGRRGIKEYRAGEALTLIALDREGKSLVCPSCGAAKVARIPKRPLRGHESEAGRISLHCDACGRNASYLARTDLPPPERSPTQKH